MKKFIFLTNEGTTQQPNGDDCENQQVLGYAWGNNEFEALSNLIKENSYIRDFSFNEIIITEIADTIKYFYLSNFI